MPGTHSSQRWGTSKVVAVFVGSHDMPSWDQCRAVLRMDPDIVPPVVVIPFEGLPETPEDVDEFAVNMISQHTPGFVDGEFTYACGTIVGLSIIKIWTAQWLRDSRAVEQAVGSVMSYFVWN